MNRCEACERPLSLNPYETDHVQPSYICENRRCPKFGHCLTCAMLVDWFERADTREGA